MYYKTQETQMQFNNEKTRNVAEIAAKIMYGEQPVSEELKGGQKKLDKNNNNKIDGQDFAILRGEKKTNEETEQIDELSKDTLHGYVKKSFSDKEKENLDTPQRQKGLRKATSRLYKEDEESLDEVKMADLPVRKVQGRAYGASKPEPHWSAGLKGPKDAELKNIEAEKKKKKFSEMLELYNEKGIKSLSEMLATEEASEEEFNKEVADAKAKNDGKKKNDEIAKGAVQSVKNEETHTTVEVIDLDPINGVQRSEIDLSEETVDERHMTEPEMKKREEIVKSMKKGMAGFKERYGDRAKNVMYATATKQAMK